MENTVTPTNKKDQDNTLKSENVGSIPSEIKERLGNDYWFICLNKKSFSELQEIVLLPENFLKKRKDIIDNTKSLAHEQSIVGEVAIPKHLISVSWHEPKTAEEMELIIAKKGREIDIPGVEGIMGNAATYANIYSQLHETMQKEAEPMVDYSEQSGTHNDHVPTKSRTSDEKVIDMSSRAKKGSKGGNRYVVAFGVKITKREYTKALPIFIYNPSVAR